MRILAALTTAVILALTGAAQSALPAAAATASDEPVPGKLLLMLDASGSMKAKDPSGLTKIEAAKKALTGVVGALPDTAQVGLRVYGAKVDGKGKPTPAACADTQLIHPIAALDKGKLTSTIGAIKALGETPIAHSLTEALKDLGTEGKRNIVLVSDGEESCVPDPCPVIKKLTAAGVDLQIDTVGFGVNAKARTQLQCIADAGKGTYYDAKDSAQLTTSLGKLSQRALRPFTVDGTPVEATADAASAPLLQPGRYTDTFAVSAAPRHYRIARTPGSMPHVALVVRPPSVQRGNGDVEEWRMELRTPDGRRCGSEREAGIEFFRNGSAMTMSVSTNAENAAKITPATDEPCMTAPELVVAVIHPQGVGVNDVQLVYVDEPAVTDVAALPEGVKPDAVEPLIAIAAGTPRAVVGGGGFGDAPELTAGSYVESVAPGEQLYYRVRLDFGQRAALTADVNPDGSAPELGPGESQLFTVDAWTPALYRITRTGGDPDNRESIKSGNPSISLTEYTPEVRYRNKASFGNGYHWPALSQTSLAGYYYFAVARTPEDKPELQAPITVRLNVAVEGEPTGRPAYAGTSPDASTSPSASPTAASDAPTAGTTDAKPAEDEGSSWFLWAGLGLVAVLGALGTAYVIVRTRLRGRPSNGGELR